jgi:hypothetical protein
MLPNGVASAKDMVGHPRLQSILYLQMNCG